MDMGNLMSWYCYYFSKGKRRGCAVLGGRVCVRYAKLFQPYRRDWGDQVVELRGCIHCVLTQPLAPLLSPIGSSP